MKWFKEIHILTLEGSEDKQANIAEQLDYFNLPFKFFYGFDGRKITNPGMTPIKPMTLSFPGYGKMKPGEIGVWLSYNAMVMSMLFNNIDGVLFLEDDANLSKNFLEILNNVDKEVPDDADIIYVGGNIPNKNVKIPVRSKISEHIYKYSKSWNMYGFFGFILTKSGAPKFLKIQNECSDIVDMAILHGIHEEKMVGYYHIPFGVSITESESVIEGKKRHDKERCDVFFDWPDLRSYRRKDYKAGLIPPPVLREKKLF